MEETSVKHWGDFYLCRNIHVLQIDNIMLQNQMIFNEKLA